MSQIENVIILKALDCLMVRAQVSAENIANANTPGYRPLKVTFEDALKKAAGLGPSAVASVQPEIVSTSAGRSGGDMRLDLELVDAGTTAGRYGALIELLNRQLQIQSLAASGTR